MLKDRDIPILAVALHSGHNLRGDIKEHLALNEAQRLREEDPFSGEWAALFRHHIVIEKSRFELDLNRPRNEAVYLSAEDAWGMDIWKKRPPRHLVDALLKEHDIFYTRLYDKLTALKKSFPKFIIYDIHTYNHRREGADMPPADPFKNPEVNVGTRTMDRNYWTPVVDGFLEGLSRFNFSGRSLDVRENIKFYGRHFPRWVHQNFPKAGCVLSIEFKKFFMDEWSGQADEQQVELVGQALAATVPGVLEALKNL